MIGVAETGSGASVGSGKGSRRLVDGAGTVVGGRVVGGRVVEGSGIVVSGTVLVVVVLVTGSRVKADAGTICHSSPRFQ